MKKVIMSIALSAMLFGDSEALYKERYDYLIGRYSEAFHKSFEVGLIAHRICFNYDRDCRIESRDAERDLPDLEREENALKDKLMDLKFKMQDELKTVPYWFDMKLK